MEAVRKIHSHLDLNSNEIRDFRFESLESSPAPAVGRPYFNPTTRTLNFWDGTEWQSIGGFWSVDKEGNVVANGNVIIRGNLIVEKDTASGGEGENTFAGIAGIRVNGTLYKNDNADGIIDLGVISGGHVDVDLTDYYTKDEADSKFISTSNIGSQSVDAASRLKWNGIIGDANALTKNGIYSFSTSTSSRPENYGVLLQLSNKDNPSATDGSSWIYQIAGGTSSTKLYVRQSINGSSWSDWAAIALTSSTVANADKVGKKGLTVSRTANFNGVAHIGSDGVMEVGRYIDFHRTNVDEVDYVTRVQLGNGTGVNTITLPESSGTLALLTSNVAAAKKLVTSALEDAVTIAANKTASFLGNIKIQPADREDVSLSFISGVESDQFYDYKIGKFTDANSISGFGIAMANANGAWVKFLSLTTDTSYNVTSVDFLRALHAKKDAYFSGHMYVGASSNLMLGDKTAGIYLTYNAISWHNDSNSYSSSIFGFDSAAIRVYKTLRPNTNQLCALGSSSYRWSGVYAATGDFSGNVSVKGNLIVTGDVASA